MFKLFPRVISILTILSLVMYPSRIYALPTDGTIVEGAGAINDAVGNSLTVDQTSSKMVADWKSFSIAAPETVRFNQPDASAIALNRVVGVNPSEIFGKLLANGRIFLVNPNGVLFGAGSQVDTAGLVASTLNISNKDFMNGNYAFTGAGGSVINAGTLSSPGGYIALLGGRVENSGAILASAGSVALASGNAVTIGLDPDNIISVAVNTQSDSNPDSANAGVINSGTITANEGKVWITANVLKSAFNNAVNNSGIVEAQNIEITGNGDVVLSSGLANSGVKATGTDGEATVSIESTEGNVSIADTEVSASIQAGEESDGNGDANIDILAGGDILIDDSSVTAQVSGNANGSAQIFLGADPDFNAEGAAFTHNISILNHSTVSAEMANGNTNAEANVEMDLTGNLDIEDSTISATAGVTESSGTPEAKIDINLFSEGEDPDVTISDSTLTAQVNGAGYASITIYDSNPNNDNPYWSDLLDQYVSGLSDLLDIGSDGSVPINGSVNITNSTLQALAADPNSYDLTDIFNNDTNNNFGAVVGIMSQGPITLTHSTISAANVNAPAAVGLFSGSSVSIDSNSTVSATTEDSLAGVGIAAISSDESGASINIAGTVTADGGDGFGVVGLLADGDVDTSAGTVSASGNLDTLGLLEDLVANNTDYTIDLGVDETIGSAVLIGSINGDVTLGDVSGDLVGVAALGLNAGDSGKGNIYGTDGGTVSGKLLALIARRNIGTSDQWLNTDVDVVTGGSYDEGDIYIDAANDITLGLYLPVTVNDGTTTTSMNLSVPLFANDGSVNVKSGGDMTINTVLALNGDVNLESLEGNIYGGNGWDADGFKTLFGEIVDLADSYSIDLGGFDPSSLDIPDFGNITAQNVSLTAGDGMIELDGSKITAENSDGDASVHMTADVITISDSDISAIVDGSGDATVNMLAMYGNLDIDASDILAETDAGYALVRMDAQYYYEEVPAVEDGEGTTSVLTGGDINITDSNVTAVVHNLPEVSESEEGPSEGPYGNAQVKLNYNDIYGSHGDVTVDNSDIAALVDDGGEAYIYIGDTNGFTDVDILDGSDVLASIGHNEPYKDTAAVYINGSNINVDDSTIQALSTDPALTGNTYVQLQAYNNGTSNGGGLLTINNSTVEANVAGYGSSTVYLYAYDPYNYNGAIDVLGGSSVLSSVGSGSALTQFYGDNINVVGSTLKSTVRDNVDGGTAYLYLYPYNYYYNQDNSITIDSSVLEASTVGRGTAAIALGSDNWNYNYYYGSGNIDITNGSSLLASVGGGEARIWAWADDIYVADSALRAQSTAGLDAAYSNAYIYLYAYDYHYYYYYSDYNDTHLTLDNASLTSDVAGLGQAYMYLLSWRDYYYYYYNYGNSTLDILNSTLLSTVGHGYAYNQAQSMGYMNIADSTITARSQALPVSNDSGYSNYAYVQLYSYDYYNNSEEMDRNLTVTNSDLTAEVLGDGEAQVYLYNYGDYYSSGNGNSNIILNNSTLRSSVTGAGSAYVYLQAYDYYNYENTDILLNNSQLSSSVGDGWSEVYLYANYGSILGDATSLLTADWVYLNALHNIGTFESPINTDTSNLVAHSSGYPVWVSDDSEEGGYYVYGDGNIYVNNVGDGLLNVGPPEDGGDTVQANDGVVSVTTKGDMVVYYVVATVGGVLLKSQNGSIYAGAISEGSSNVFAGGASYFSAPNGTIGVGYPGEDKDLTVSGQIQGIVDPGVTAGTEVNPSPDIDLSQGNPSGTVWYNSGSESGSQQIWPAAVSGSVPSNDNPLKVNIQVVPGAPSVIPDSVVPAFGGPVGLMLQFGNRAIGGDPSQLANLLAGSFRKYYGILDGYRYVPFDLVRPLGFFAYHPLTETDSSAFDGFNLDEGAYDFIDGNLAYNGEFDPGFGGKKKK